MAYKIASTTQTLEQNRDVFAQLTLTNIRLRIQRSSDAQTGKLIPCSFVVLVEDAECADIRDYGGSKVGCVFVKGPTPEEEMQHLEIRVENMMNEFPAGKLGNQQAR
jgi:hypothetical protein